MTAALTHFLSNLPHRPYCSNDLSTGVQIRRRDLAVAKSYIQPNPPALLSWLIFDCDHDRTYGAWDDAGLPPPNMAVINRDNGRGHLYYLLRTVCRSNAARVAPLRFAAAIEHAYTTKLGADPGYAGLVAKNPFSPDWFLHDLHGTVHTLGDLAEWVDLRQWSQGIDKRAAAVSNGLGRNCTLFDRLRLWAYGRVNLYREGVLSAQAFEMFAQACHIQAGGFNDFGTPLPFSEVKAIARSVSKWTWRHYQSGGVKRGRDGHGFTRHHDFDVTSGIYLPKTPKLAPAEIVQRRQRSALQTAAQKAQATGAKIATAKATLKAQGKPTSLRALAKATGLSYPTVQAHLAKGGG